MARPDLPASRSRSSAVVECIAAVGYPRWSWTCRRGNLQYSSLRTPQDHHWILEHVRKEAEDEDHCFVCYTHLVLLVFLGWCTPIWCLWECCVNHTAPVLTSSYYFTVQSLSCMEIAAIRFSLIDTLVTRFFVLREYVSNYSRNFTYVIPG